MNHQDVINEVARLTNIDSAICEKVIKSFESNAGITSTLRGFLAGAMESKKIAITIANETGISADICEKVLDVFTATVGNGIKAKFKF